MKTKILLTITAILISATGLFSQVTDTAKLDDLRVITKNDGYEYIGVIISDDGREILIETENLGKIYVLKSEIRSIIKVEDNSSIVYGEFRSSGPFTTRYAFTTNGHPIKKGENYAMVNLYGPEIHFAVMNNFSIGVMSTWIGSPMILALKYTIKTNNPKFNLALGTLMGSSCYLNNFRGFGGLHWLTLTVGDRLNNVSFSGGYAYLRSGIVSNTPIDGIYYNESPDVISEMKIYPAKMFSIAGIFKVGAKASFVFDSMCILYDETTSETNYQEITPRYYDDIINIWVEPTYINTVTSRKWHSAGLLLMPGIRFQKSENRAFQISLSGISLFGNNNLSFPFPMFSWYYRF